MDSEDDVSLTSFRPLSPDRSKPGTFLARFFQKKRPEARVEVKIDSSKKHRPVSPLVSPRSSPQLQKRASTSKSPELQRSWSASPLIGRRTSANANPHRRASHGYRNVHAVLGRLNAAADGQGQVNTLNKNSLGWGWGGGGPSQLLYGYVPPNGVVFWGLRFRTGYNIQVVF